MRRKTKGTSRRMESKLPLPWTNPTMLALLRDCISESMDPRPYFKHCNTFLCPITIWYLAVFIDSDYKNIFLPSILHFYHYLFVELVHLYNLPLYWVCWGHKRSLVFGCRVVWEGPSLSYTSHGLINLRSSTWGKIAAVLQNSALGCPTRVYKNKIT